MPRTLAAPDSTPEPLAPRVFECSLVNGDPDAVCVRVAGELDIATSPGLDVALQEALLSARLVVVDLRDVEFIDSAGVHAIVNATRQARTLARRVVILRGPAHVDRIFKLTGTFEVLEFAGADGRRAGLRRGVATPASEPEACVAGTANVSVVPYNVTMTLRTQAVQAVLAAQRHQAAAGHARHVDHLHAQGAIAGSYPAPPIEGNHGEFYA